MVIRTIEIIVVKDKLGKAYLFQDIKSANNKRSIKNMTRLVYSSVAKPDVSFFLEGRNAESMRVILKGGRSMPPLNYKS